MSGNRIKRLESIRAWWHEHVGLTHKHEHYCNSYPPVNTSRPRPLIQGCSVVASLSLYDRLRHDKLGPFSNDPQARLYTTLKTSPRQWSFESAAMTTTSTIHIDRRKSNTMRSPQARLNALDAATKMMPKLSIRMISNNERLHDQFEAMEDLTSSPAMMLFQLTLPQKYPVQQ
ncbi:hypothetical protein AC579_5676 [Pseudocercospora musae]|uniref:Uncharacterized protein n=1 Tax=Pseudocercospora musae TaxID=113226 RepID=A0A139HCN2_9PEZI|nr:hypothetical protein AC579_5676 [Pseudocercospora musae]